MKIVLEPYENIPLSLYQGLPKPVTELMVWNTISRLSISIRFSYVERNEAGLFEILFYHITLSSQNGYKRTFEVRRAWSQSQGI